MLNSAQKKTTALELQNNFAQLKISREQVLADLQFTEEQLRHALYVNDQTNGYDVWKLRDYTVDLLQEQGTQVVPYTILQNNIWYHYHKTWR